MHDENSRVARSSSVQAEEDSASSLPGRKPTAPQGAPLPPSAQADDSRLTAQPEGELGDAHAQAAGDDLSTRERKSYRICRATTPLRVDFDRLDKDSKAALRKELREARKLLVTGSNFLIRLVQRLDEEQLDSFLEKNHRLPKSVKELPAPKLKSSGYYEMVRAVPQLATGVASAGAVQAFSRWDNDRWKVLVLQEARPSRFTHTLPIPARAQDWRLEEREDGWWLRVLFRAAEHGGVAQWIPVEIRDEFQRMSVERIAAGAREVDAYRKVREKDRAQRKKDGDNKRKKGVSTAQAVSAENWAPGELKLKEDKKRPGRWYIRISYKKLVERSGGGLVAAVNRGIHSHLVCVTSEGEWWRYNGNDIRAYLKQVQERRRQYQYDAKACMRHGRGRKRILRPIAPLEAKAERWRQTKCQTIARRLSEWLADRGVGAVIHEDFLGIRHGEPERLKGGERIWRMVQEWPYHQQGTRLESCLEEAGIKNVFQSAYYISQRCPKCGYISDDNRDLRRWRLRCTNPEKCDFSQDLDVAACMNDLARAQAQERGEPWDLEEMGLTKNGKEKSARKEPSKEAKPQGSSRVRRKGTPKR